MEYDLGLGFSCNQPLFWICIVDNINTSIKAGTVLHFAKPEFVNETVPLSCYDKLAQEYPRLQTDGR